MKRFLTLAALTLTAVGTTSPAHAAVLTLTQSGIFGADSTLNGMAFEADTPFTFQATFDSTTDTFALNGLGAFPAVATFTIAGYGTYTSDPAGGLVATFVDPDIAPPSARDWAPRTGARVSRRRMTSPRRRPSTPTRRPPPS